VKSVPPLLLVAIGYLSFLFDSLNPLQVSYNQGETLLMGHVSRKLWLKSNSY